MKDNKLTWNDITYRDFESIKKASEIEDETDRAIAIAQAVYGDDIILLPIQQFNEVCKGLSFLQTEIPTSIKVKNVIVNGREYYFDGMLGEVSTAQYIDFQNYLKNQDMAKLYSVFFIPKGHKYNDGYDMLQVFDDIYDMPIPTLYSASFFFNRQFELFIKIFQRSLMKQIKNLDLPKDVKKNLQKIVTNSNSLAFSHLFSNFAK